VSHPFVVGLLHAFITEAKVYLVLEYCSGGDLHQHLMAADHSRFPETQARFYTAELVLALEYLHELGVIYRDLKPENVLLDTEGHVRLADFGLCRAGVQDDAAATSFCGSPAYLSPEMVGRNGHGQATDWWGLGVLLYEMLTGDPPFQGRDIEGLFAEIKEAEVQLVSHTKVSPEAMALIKGLLAKDAVKRLKAVECKSHDFFANHVPPLRAPEDWQALFERKFTPPFVPPNEDGEDVGADGGAKKEKPGCLVM
jgi:serine/threonine protein kinase